MAINRTRAARLFTVAVLLGGIAAAIAFLWIPRLGGDSSAIPELQQPFWRMVDSEELVIKTSSVNVAVHDIIASPRHLTVVYSVNIPGGESEGEEATINLKTNLVGSNGDVHSAVDAHGLGFFDGVTLGSITFEPYKPRNAELSLVIPELSLGSPDASQSFILGDPVEMKVLTRLRPREYTETIFRLPGVRTEAEMEGPYGSFLGSAPQGQVATVSYNFGGVDRYFLAKMDGHFEELSEEQMGQIAEHLGITVRN